MINMKVSTSQSTSHLCLVGHPETEPETELFEVLPTSRVGCSAGKPSESAVQCLNDQYEGFNQSEY